MFVIKLIFGFILIYFGVKIGKNRANRYKEEYLFWKSMLFICDKTYSELEFKKNSIDKILNVDYQSEDFQNLIKEFLKSTNVIAPYYVKSEELIYINEFFVSITKNDTNSLKSTLISLSKEFNKIVNEKEKTYRKYYNLSIKLGFFAGFSLLIMVI